VPINTSYNQNEFEALMQFLYETEPMCTRVELNVKSFEIRNDSRTTSELQLFNIFTLIVIQIVPITKFVPLGFDDRILEVVAVFGSVQMAACRLINLQHHRIAQCQSVQINILGNLIHFSLLQQH
jgi:hypothetical protein